MPAAAAPRAIASSPSGCAMRWNAVGATSTGSEISRPEDGRRRRHLRDVDEHSRPQHPALERRAILAHRPLVAGPADDVAERGGVEPLLGRALVVPDVEELLLGHRERAYSGAGAAIGRRPSELRRLALWLARLDLAAPGAGLGAERLDQRLEPLEILLDAARVDPDLRAELLLEAFRLVATSRR